MKTILTILFLGVLSGKGQIINASRPYVPMPSGVSYLLDDYPNAAAAYSLRKLKSSYSGSAIRIRRDSTGNAETDIGFLASGELDTTAIKNHCRNNSCMVTTWYNQGDSTAVNFTQSTAAAQPRIMTTGTIERRSGKPTIRFDVSGTSDWMQVASSTVKFNYLHKAGQAAIFGVLQVGTVSNPDVQYFILDNNGFNGARTGFSLYYDDRSSSSFNNRITSAVLRNFIGTRVSIQNINNYFAPDTLALLTNLLDNSTATAANRNILYRNGYNEQKTNTNTDAAANRNADFNMYLGSNVGVSNYLNGYFSEIIFYPTDQTSNRTGIETNINNFYSLW